MPTRRKNPPRNYATRGESSRTKRGRPAVAEDGQRMAATWIQEHMVEEAVCDNCSSHISDDEGDLGLEEITDFIRNFGIPDAISEGKADPVTLAELESWWNVLSGGSSPPRLNVSKSHKADAEVSRQFDIDAFIAEATSLEALRGFRFSYYPRSNRNLAKPIHIWFHGQRLHRCRHMRFGEALHAQDVEVFVAFPNMPWTRETYLTEEQHALWIDEVVLPSLRERLPPTSMQHYPPTWAAGASKMRAKHNEHRTWDVGGTNAIHYPVKEQYTPGLWESMKERTSQPRLAGFRGMFLVIQTYGTKLVWHDPSFSTLRKNFVAALDKSVNITHLVRSKMYVDLGKETISLNEDRIQWWKKCCQQNWVASLNPKNHVRTRFYPVSGLRDAAAVNIEPSQKHPMHPHVVYAQRYSNYKELFDAGKVFPFTNKNIESLLIPQNLLQLWSKAGGAHSRSNHIQKLVASAGKTSYIQSKKRTALGLDSSQNESLGTREEYRTAWDLFMMLDLDTCKCRQAEPRPYLSIPTQEALAFLRWELNRWLGALDYLIEEHKQLTPATGAIGTMLARIVNASCNDGQYGLPYDLYKARWKSKKENPWLGLALETTVEERGMFWLRESTFDWNPLQFKESIQDQFRFYIPDSQRTYKERRSAVNNATKLYNGINDIAQLLTEDDGLGDHRLERIRRICYLALTIEVLHYDVKNQPSPPPKDLQSYNLRICHSWLCQYYSTEFHIPKGWRLSVVWKKSPTWADLLQQLFDWDDQHLYKVPFSRDRWKSLPFRLVTCHAYNQILQRLGPDAAGSWKSSLGVYACQFFWMLPKCTGTRFASYGKKTHKDGDVHVRKTYTSWYSATYLQLVDYNDDEELGAWDWQDQRLWSWEAGSIINHVPVPLFDNLDEFDFAPARTPPQQKKRRRAHRD